MIELKIISLKYINIYVNIIISKLFMVKDLEKK